MEFNQYQTLVTKVKKYSKDNRKAFFFLLCKLQEETGEVFKEMARLLEEGEEYDRTKLKLELGDILWCITSLSEQAGIKLDEVAHSNVLKLEERKLL